MNNNIIVSNNASIFAFGLLLTFYSLYAFKGTTYINSGSQCVGCSKNGNSFMATIKNKICHLIMYFR